MVGMMRMKQWLSSRHSLVCYCSKLEMDSAVDQEPVQLFKQKPRWTARMQASHTLKDNMSEGVLYLLGFKDDRVRTKTL